MKGYLGFRVEGYNSVLGILVIAKLIQNSIDYWVLESSSVIGGRTKEGCILYIKHTIRKKMDIILPYIGYTSITK